VRQAYRPGPIGASCRRQTTGQPLVRPASRALIQPHGRRRLLATVLSLTPMYRAMARSLMPRSRRCAAFAPISRYAGAEPPSTMGTITGIPAAVRILCVRVHSQQRVRNLRNFAPLQVFRRAKAGAVRANEFLLFASGRGGGRPQFGRTSGRCRPQGTPGSCVAAIRRERWPGWNSSFARGCRAIVRAA
jgi:hypothetical protein